MGVAFKLHGPLLNKKIQKVIEVGLFAILIRIVPTIDLLMVAHRLHLLLANLDLQEHLAPSSVRGPCENDGQTEEHPGTETPQHLAAAASQFTELKHLRTPEPLSVFRLERPISFRKTKHLIKVQLKHQHIWSWRLWNPKDGFTMIPRRPN